jgi:hypothetical protein
VVIVFGYVYCALTYLWYRGYPFIQWKVRQGASETTYIIDSYDGIPVISWAFAEPGKEQPIILLKEPKEFLINPTDTLEVYTLVLGIIYFSGPVLSMQIC